MSTYAYCKRRDGAIGYGQKVPEDAIDIIEAHCSLSRLKRVVEDVAQAARDGTLRVPDYTGDADQKMAALIQFAGRIERGLYGLGA